MNVARRVSKLLGREKPEDVAAASQPSELGVSDDEVENTKLRLRRGTVRTRMEDSDTYTDFCLVPSGYFAKTRGTSTRKLLKNVLDCLGLETPDMVFQVPLNWSTGQYLSSRFQLPDPNKIFEVIAANGLLEEDQDRAEGLPNGLYDSWERLSVLEETASKDEECDYNALLIDDAQRILTWALNATDKKMNGVKGASRLLHKTWKQPYVEYLRRELRSLRAVVNDLKAQVALKQEADTPKVKKEKKGVLSSNFLTKSLFSGTPRNQGTTTIMARRVLRQSQRLEWGETMTRRDVLDATTDLHLENRPISTWTELIDRCEIKLDKIENLIRAGNAIATMDLHEALRERALVRAILITSSPESIDGNQKRKKQEELSITLMEILQRAQYYEEMGRENAEMAQTTPVRERASTGTDSEVSEEFHVEFVDKLTAVSEGVEETFFRWREMASVLDTFLSRRQETSSKLERLKSIMYGLTKALHEQGSILLSPDPFHGGGINALMRTSKYKRARLLSVTNIDELQKRSHYKVMIHSCSEFDPSEDIGTRSKKVVKVDYAEVKQDWIKREEEERGEDVEHGLSAEERLKEVKAQDAKTLTCISTGLGPLSFETASELERASGGDISLDKVKIQMIRSDLTHLVVFETAQDATVFQEAIMEHILCGYLLFCGKSNAFDVSRRMLKQNAPLFVFKGSGGTADIFATVATEKMLLGSGKGNVSAEKEKEVLKTKLQNLYIPTNTAFYNELKRSARVLASDWPAAHSCMVIDVQDSVQTVQEKVTRTIAERNVSIDTPELGAFSSNQNRLRHAWENYVMFEVNHRHYMMISNILRYLVATQSLAAVIAATLLASEGYCPGSSDDCPAARVCASLMPILAAILFGIEEVIEPRSHAMRLLVAKYSIEKEIFSFRASVGPYARLALGSVDDSSDSKNKTGEKNDQDMILEPREIFSKRVDEILEKVKGLVFRQSATGSLLRSYLSAIHDNQARALIASLRRQKDSTNFGALSTDGRNGFQNIDGDYENEGALSSPKRNSMYDDLSQEMPSVGMIQVLRDNSKHLRQKMRCSWLIRGEVERPQDTLMEMQAYYTGENRYLGQKLNELNPLHYALSAEVYRSTRFELLMADLLASSRRLHTWNLAFQVLILGSTTISGFFVLINIVEWTPLLLTVAAILAGWRELMQLSQRLKEATQAFAAMKQLVSWWDSLSIFNKRMPGNMRRLVEEAESIYFQQVHGAGFVDQREAGKATAVAVGKLHSKTSQSAS